MTILHQACALTCLYFIWKHRKGRSRLSEILWLAACVTTGISLLVQLASWLYLNAFTHGKRLTATAYKNAVRLDIDVPRGWTIRAGHYIQLTVLRKSLFSLPCAVCWWEVSHNGKATALSLLVPNEHKRLPKKAIELDGLSAWLQGPFGVSYDFTQYGTVAMFCTGIGIAAHLPYIKGLMQAAEKHQTRIRNLRLYWEPDDPSKWHNLLTNYIA